MAGTLRSPVAVGRFMSPGSVIQRVISRFRFSVTVVAVAVPLVVASATRAQEVTIGFQLIYNPWKVAISDQAFERATGYRIHWKKFDSGAKMIAALASGDVQIGLAGSSPVAAGVSGGVPIELFWIAEDIAAAEALVVRDGTGIIAPQDLVGKRLGVPFGSTSHFHTLFALEQFGIDPEAVELHNLQPQSIVAAWERGEIDAAFVWNPALADVKRNGRVLITSGHLSEWGRATFDGMVVLGAFARDHAGFMCKFVSVMALADEAYRSNPDSFGPGTENARKIARLVGGEDEDVKPVLDLYRFPTLAEQASARWLGGDEAGGGARALRLTSEFLLKEGKIEALAPTYGPAVRPEFVEAALNGC